MAAPREVVLGAFSAQRARPLVAEWRAAHRRRLQPATPMRDPDLHADEGVLRSRWQADAAFDAGARYEFQ